MSEASLENGSSKLGWIGDNQLRILFEDVEPDKIYSCYVDIGDACAEKGSMQCLFYNRKITKQDDYTGNTECFGNTIASSGDSSSSGDNSVSGERTSGPVGMSGSVDFSIDGAIDLQDGATH